MNVVFREMLVSQGNWGTHYLAQIQHCIMQKDDFPLYNTNQKRKLAAKNKEPEQKHVKLIYCILFTCKRNKQLSDYLLLLIPYFAFWHIRTIVVCTNNKKYSDSKTCTFLYLPFFYLLLLLSLIYLSSLRII